jgi:hypothetical protein
VAIDVKSFRQSTANGGTLTVTPPAGQVWQLIAAKGQNTGAIDVRIGAFSLSEGNNEGLGKSSLVLASNTWPVVVTNQAGATRDLSATLIDITGGVGAVKSVNYSIGAGAYVDIQPPSGEAWIAGMFENVPNSPRRTYPVLRSSANITDQGNGSLLASIGNRVTQMRNQVVLTNALYLRWYGDASSTSSVLLDAVALPDASVAVGGCYSVASGGVQTVVPPAGEVWAVVLKGGYGAFLMTTATTTKLGELVKGADGAGLITYVPVTNAVGLYFHAVSGAAVFAFTGTKSIDS